jgi:hypothetical protein
MALSNTKVSIWEFQETSGTNENEVFKEWNGETQEGIFLISNNTNKSFSETPSYNQTRLTPSRPWFNDISSDSTNSSIPVIDINNSIEKFLYVRCYFIIHDSPIFLGNKGYSGRGYLTTDFNITKGINSNKELTDPKVTFYSIDNNYLYRSDPTPVWLNNLKDNENKVYENTKPYIIYQSDLSKKPSSFLKIYGSWLLRDVQGDINLITNPFIHQGILYINNSESPDLTDLLNVEMVSSEITRTSYNSDGSINQTIVGDSSDSSLELLLGKNYTITIPFYNSQDYTLNITFLRKIYQCNWPKNRGLIVGNLNESETIIETISFPPKEKINISTNYSLPESFNTPMGLVLIREKVVWSNEKSPSLDMIYWPTLGSDTHPYLTFEGIIPKKQLDTKTNPPTRFYNLTIGLKAESFYNNLDIKQEDYNLSFALISEMDEVQIHIQNYSLPSDINKSKKVYFNIITTNNPEWDEKGRIFAKVYAILNNEYNPQLNLKDQIISISNGNIYFEPGDLSYQINDTLRFSPNATIDFAKIILDNPSYYSNKINVSIANVTSENFSFSFDGTNFDQTSKEYELYPNQFIEITLFANATYSTWPVTSPVNLTERLIVSTISKEFKQDDGEILQNHGNNLTYKLLVEADDYEWFDLVSTGFTIPSQTNPRQAIFLDQEDSTKSAKLKVEWSSEGSISGLSKNHGKGYNVKASVIDNGTEVYSTTKRYIVNGSKREFLTLEFSHLFNYSRYNITIELYKNNEINETNSLNDSIQAEIQNNKTFDLPAVVTGCQYQGYIAPTKDPEDFEAIVYSSFSYAMTRLDFHLNQYRDTENICECPIERLPIWSEGYCLDPNSRECISIQSETSCNYNNLTKDYYNGSACFWNKTSCLNCNSMIHTCGDYNNIDSCIKDPCQKARVYDCSVLGCDYTGNSECYWNTNSQTCGINTTIDNQNCLYNITIPQKCSSGVFKMNVIYETNSLGCTNHTREFLCGQEISVIPFFTTTNTLIAILALIAIYLFSKKKK